MQKYRFFLYYRYTCLNKFLSLRRGGQLLLLFIMEVRREVLKNLLQMIV